MRPLNYHSHSELSQQANKTRTKQSKLNQKNTQNAKRKQMHTKNSSGDERVNMKFFYDDILYVLQNHVEY